jgi:hypothetical protein
MVALVRLERPKFLVNGFIFIFFAKVIIVVCLLNRWRDVRVEGDKIIYWPDILQIFFFLKNKWWRCKRVGVIRVDFLNFLYRFFLAGVLERIFVLFIILFLFFKLLILFMLLIELVS